MPTVGTRAGKTRQTQAARSRMPTAGARAGKTRQTSYLASFLRFGFGASAAAEYLASREARKLWLSDFLA